MNEIPHIIHYCWFGGKPLPTQYEAYLQTWIKAFPDYKIIKWDENNFPIGHYDYAKEAMQDGKMAFVSDVARIHALYEWGGVYFDTDVEVLKNFTNLLQGKSAVLGIEDAFKTIGTGFMAFAPKHPICEKMLEYYKKASFSTQDISMSNTQILAELIKREYNIDLADKEHELGDLIIYPSSYFTAYNGFTGITEIASETCCVHHFSASWHSPIRKFKDGMKRRWHRILQRLYR